MSGLDEPIAAGSRCAFSDMDERLSSTEGPWLRVQTDTDVGQEATVPGLGAMRLESTD